MKLPPIGTPRACPPSAVEASTDMRRQVKFYCYECFAGCVQIEGEWPYLIGEKQFCSEECGVLHEAEIARLKRRVTASNESTS